MSYRLGVDLGTTHTAAAVYRGGRVTLVRLGIRTAETPTVLYLLGDGTWRVGDAAERRGAVDPTRVARQFKRRLGDPVPLLIGGSPSSAQALMAVVLRHVVRLVQEQEGGPPEELVVTHPAAWGPYRQETFDQALRLADVGPTTTRSEPEAAVLQYATDHPLELGQTVVVYDLGGGTFDTAVVRRATDGLQLAGAPEGIEHLGGSDFDEAVFRHVVDAIGAGDGDVDLQDPAVLADVARLRADCREAKEALSHDTDVIINAALPGAHAQVSLSREQLAAMLRPALTQTLEAVRRALRAAQVDPEDVTAVVLAGGSSRIPLVRELLVEAFERPVVNDGHPEHMIALGAAQPALGAASGLPPAATVGLPTASPKAARSGARAGSRRVVDPETVPVERPSADSPSRPLPVVSPAQEQAPAPTPPREPTEGPKDDVATTLRRHAGRRGRLRPGRNQALAAGLVLLLVALGTALGVQALMGGDAGGTSTWTPLEPLSVASDSPGVASFRGEVWVVGGLSQDARSLDSVLVLDPDDDTWREGPRLPTPIDHAALVSTGDRLVLLGGQRDAEPGADVTRMSVSTVYELDDPDGQWRSGVDLPEPRGAPAAAWDGERIVVGGGVDVDRQPQGDIWALTGTEWEHIGDLQRPRDSMAAASDGDGTTWFLGGSLRLDDGRAALTDIVKGSVVELGPSIEPVGTGAALWSPDTGPCVLGGRRPEGPSARVECLDADEPPPPLPEALVGPGATVLDGKWYLVGGSTSTERGSRLAFVLDPL